MLTADAPAEVRVIPKGCVLLTAAVDRLAEARRTAGQTSDEGQNAAREELRAELHSESMLAMVISSCSGDTFAIRPRHWAREIALTWLEQGECLLNEDFVDPWPLSMALSAQSVGSPENIPPVFPKMLRGERATFLTHGQAAPGRPSARYRDGVQSAQHRPDVHHLGTDLGAT